MNLEKIININLINRFDIIVKYLYIKNYYEKHNSNYFREFYRKHEIMYNGGIEIVHEELIHFEKSNINQFENSFIKLIKLFEKEGFNSNYPIIIDKESGKLLNGAHRLACCLYFNVEPTIEYSKGNISDWSFSWFKNNYFSEDNLRDLLYWYSNFIDNYYIAIIWPSFIDKKDEIIKLIGKENDIIGNYTLNLSSHNLGELVYDTYSFDHGPFPGMGIDEKVIFFKKYKPKCEIVLIKVKTFNKKEIIDTKVKVRNKYIDDINYINKESIGFFIMHSSDRKEERDYMKDILLSNINIKYLNYRDNIITSKNLLHLLKLYNNVLNKKQINVNDTCIVKGSILEIYGLKKSADIDFITKNIEKNKERVINISPRVDLANHEYLSTISNEEIINNKYYHFYYRGYKFTTLELLKKSKELEGRKKDLIHIKLIEDFLNNKNNNKLISNYIIKNKLLLFFYIRKNKILLFHKLRNFLKKIGLYKSISFLWRKYILKNIK